MTIFAHLEVELRPRERVAVAYPANDLSLFYLVSGFFNNFREMPVNSIVTLTVIDNHHFAIARETISIHHRTLLDCLDFFTHCGVDVDTFAHDFSGELWMFKFTERRDHLAGYGPLHFAA